MFVSTIIGQSTETPMPRGASSRFNASDKPDDGELRRAVDAEPLHADEAGHRRGVDDVAALLLREEPRHERLDAVHDAPEVHAHRVFPVRVRRLRHLAEERDAGVVADDVHGTVVADRLVGERVHGGQIADVGPDAVRRGAGASQRLDGAPQRGVVHVGEHELRAAGGERARHRHADAAGAARDHRYATGEGIHAPAYTDVREPHNARLDSGGRRGVRRST
jgi:hypothetical protein